jgi:hypothetical protein
VTFLTWGWMHKEYGLETADDPDGGSWLISQRGDVFDTKYQLPIAFSTSEEYDALQERFKALPDDNGGFWCKEKQRIHASKGGHQELGFGQSRFEAKRLIEFIREGDAGLPDLETMLRENNFTDRFHHKNSVTWQHSELKRLNLAVTDESIYCRYDGTRGAFWYNLMHIEGTNVGHNMQSQHYKFYPPSVTGDHRRIGVRFIEWLIRERRERGGKFNVPLR